MAAILHGRDLYDSLVTEVEEMAFQVGVSLMWEVSSSTLSSAIQSKVSKGMLIFLVLVWKTAGAFVGLCLQRILPTPDWFMAAGVRDSNAARFTRFEINIVAICALLTVAELCEHTPEVLPCACCTFTYWCIEPIVARAMDKIVNSPPIRQQLINFVALERVANTGLTADSAALILVFFLMLIVTCCGLFIQSTELESATVNETQFVHERMRGDGSLIKKIAIQQSELFEFENATWLRIPKY